MKNYPFNQENNYFSLLFSHSAASLEKYCNICPDIVKEFAKYDLDPHKWIKQYTGINAINRNQFIMDVGYERFLGPEISLYPEVGEMAAQLLFIYLYVR